MAGIESEVRHRAPKCCGHVFGNCGAVVWRDVTVDDDRVGVHTEAINGLVVADPGLEVVCARHKENRNVSGAELRNTAHRTRVEYILSCCVPGLKTYTLGPKIVPFCAKADDPQERSTTSVTPMNSSLPTVYRDKRFFTRKPLF
jgi:hypothetical protein